MTHRARKRVVISLEWATDLPVWPSHIPDRKPRKQCKINGIRYENACAKALPNMVHGQWFSFKDKNGQGYCQVDLLQIGSDAILVIEVKNTWTADAHDQLERLYKPVVEHVYKRPMIGLVMVRYLTPQISKHVVVVNSVLNGIAAARLGSQAVLHWPGRASLKPVDPFDPLLSLPKRSQLRNVEEVHAGF